MGASVTVRDTHSELAAEDFFREHVHTNQPLVLRGGVKDWRGLCWSAEYLRQWDDEVVTVAPLQVRLRTEKGVTYSLVV